MRNADGCWLWTGTKNEHGYGLMFSGTRNAAPLKAHRVSYELHVGPISDGLWVLHRCDNPPCTRPDHLFLGTQQDNTDDMMAKGRYVGFKNKDHRGSRSPRSKLTEPVVADVLRRLAAGEQGSVIAADLGVSKSTISLIGKRKTWRHVEAAS